MIPLVRPEAESSAVRVAVGSCIDEMGDLTSNESRERIGCHDDQVSDTASFVFHLLLCHSFSIQGAEALNSFALESARLTPQKVRS
jgi:hypothetical protein